MTTAFHNDHVETGCCVSTICGGTSSSSSQPHWGRKRTTAHNDNHTASAASNDGTDAELAKEMNALSVQERSKALEELHGVADMQDETPEFVSSKINAFDDALNKIPKIKRRASEKAFFLRPTLQSDVKFKLMFLRSDHYDAGKAAARMAKFFDWKHRLFGEEKLGKDITLDDLHKKDIEIAFLSGGCLQLPNTDPAGRPITMFDTSKIDVSYQEEMLRVQYYLIMTALEDEVAQMKGFTNLTYAPESRPSNIPIAKTTENLMAAGDLMASLPVRITGYHYCTDNPALQFVLSIIRMALGKQVRLRLRSHYGSALEISYSLMTFGINCKDLLASSEGKTYLHDEYLERRRKKELAMANARKDEEAKSGNVLYPRPNDVLIGRGRPYHEFSGTRHLIDELIDSQLDRYFQSNDRFWKTCINIEVVKKTLESNGRFLQRTKTGWKVLNDTTAREKTANLFRYRSNYYSKGGSAKAPPPSVPSSALLSWANNKVPNLIGGKRSRDDSSMDDSMGSGVSKRTNFSNDSF